MANLGLSTAEVEEQFKKFGPNDVSESKTGLVKKLLTPLYSPISLMLLGAAFLSFISNKIFDFYFILALYFVNYSIQQWQEFKADNAIRELQNKLSFDVSTLRDEKWIFVSAKMLVPGDRIRLGLGSIIPADAEVTSAKNLSVNEAVLTGESLPKDKKAGDRIFSGSFVTTGNLEAEVTQTGKNTKFGKTIFSIEQASEKSLLEKDILSITRFLTIVSIVAVIILSVVFLIKGDNLTDLLTIDLSLIIAGIPVALPAVMTIILSIGAAELAKKKIIVRRLSALEGLANVNLLLTDKTGTLTKNEIVVAEIISYQKEFSVDDVIELASFAASSATPDAIDSAVTKRFALTNRLSLETKVIDFIPFDSDRKRSTAVVEKNGKKLLISLGAPQVIGSLVNFGEKELKSKFTQDVETAATNGYRVLALSIKENSIEEKEMKIAGLLYLADPLDETSKETIEFMEKNGITVKMVTGDNRLIAGRIAQELGLPGKITVAEDTKKYYDNKTAFYEKFNDTAAFAEILPKDKYEIVKAFKAYYIVASTGDGVNDLPALKIANVGIAVSRAVSALKSMADIVLLGQGLSVIQDAILESRKIFVRLYNYSVYRISESFRLIITILVLGLWYGFYPLLPLQIILLAFLNDIPIISLAVDRVKVSKKPSEIKTGERLSLSILFGFIGTLNSIFLFVIVFNILHYPIGVVQTMFFLKLTVSGHMLIYVAHTKERWWKFLPAKQVIIATFVTQIVSTILALTGFLMPGKISVGEAGFVWLWALIWMQFSELMKYLQAKFISERK